MKITAGELALLAVVWFFAGCHHRPQAAAAMSSPAPSSPTMAAMAPLSPSPRLIVGRVLAVDAAQRFAIVELVSEPPRDALLDGTELIARTFSELRETARLRASRYTRGRTLGTTILSGQPAVGDEVVWLAP